MERLAIIPARAGSKRLPGKNLRLLAGKPLVQWTLEAARDSAAIDAVLVSSDDPHVLSLAEAFEATQTLTRPPALATDEARSSDVLLHALDHLAAQGLVPESVCLLQPTSPLRTAADIDAAFALFEGKGRRPVISVCEVDHPLAWCGRIDASLSLGEFAKRLAVERRSQDMEREYRLNGAIYIATTADFRRHRGFLNADTLAHIMPRERSVDIDVALDLALAETLIAASAGR